MVITPGFFWWQKLAISPQSRLQRRRKSGYTSTFTAPWATQNHFDKFSEILEKFWYKNVIEMVFGVACKWFFQYHGDLSRFCSLGRWKRGKRSNLSIFSRVLSFIHFYGKCPSYLRDRGDPYPQVYPWYTRMRFPND